MPETSDSAMGEAGNIFKNLFYHAPVGILRTSGDGRILHVNEAVLTMLGYESFEQFSAATGLMAENIYQKREDRQRMVDSIATGGGPMHFDSDWLQEDGTALPCRLHVRASFSPDGSIRYFDGFVEDISQQQAVERDLVESEKRYRSIFENTGSGTIIIENDTTISLVNERFAAITGYDRAEIEGRMKWPEFVASPQDRERMLRYHYSRRRGDIEPPIEYEFLLKDKHHNRKEVFLRVDVITGTDRSVASLLDISSLKEARRHLLQSSSRLSGILAAFEGDIYICTPDYRLTFMNGRLEQTVASTGTSDPCHRQLFNADTPCQWCKMEQVLKGYTVRFEYLDPVNGRWHYGVSSPIYEEENLVSQVQTVTIDIHERKLAEIALKERESHLHRENQRLRRNIGESYRFGAIVGKSRAMQKVYELILRAAATDANVILYGESGTGKELVAREIHNMSDRSGKTFLPVNCGAIPSDLLESEFFGYRKGAFTGAERDKPGYLEKAGGGTLFLDELGEITESMQIKLLRALEGYGYTPVGSPEPQVSSVRIISATNRNLRQMLDTGRMREDFFYRIHIIPIEIPPLRRRREDIPLLVEQFLRKHGKDKETGYLNGHQMERLMQHDWPGNVRELENTIQRYLNLNVLDFPGKTCVPQPPGRYEDLHCSAEDVNLRQASRRFEKRFILEQLERNGWHRSRTAKALGIRRKTLYLKMKQLGINL